MARVKSYGNLSTELRLRSVFRQFKITGWRRHFPIQGRPDFVFRRERLAIFVDGCFWHGCPKCYKRPRTNPRFWREKYKYNAARDRLNTLALRKSGWVVVRIWEHELKTPYRVARRILQPLAKLGR
jgi:DNA mismatch endonuclease (patch repair protein)